MMGSMFFSKSRIQPRATEVRLPAESDRVPQQATVRAGRVVVAAGGGCVESLLAGAIPALPTAPWRPTLGPLAVAFPENVSSEELDGIRSHVRISLPNSGFSEEGEVLFRGYGISGIVVFNASRYAHTGETLLVDFLPGNGNPRSRSGYLCARRTSSGPAGAYAVPGIRFARIGRCSAGGIWDTA